MSFWGLTVEPEKKYSQTVDTPFIVTSAAIDPSGGNGNSVLYLQINGEEFVLCTLNKNKWPQYKLKTLLSAEDDICFFVKGDRYV